MQATRHGFMRTGYDSLCPFHGKPAPEPVAPLSGLTELHAKAAPFMAPPVAVVPICGDCELRHAPDVRCDFVDEN